jgi:Ni,Fe-hydrogenase III large subunit/Ni,Fe-hydrogenase III component G
MVKDIVEADFKDFRADIITQCFNEKRPIAFFGIPEGGKYRVYVVLSDDENSNLMVMSSVLEGGSYESITLDIPSFHMLEREFYEETGIKPEGHPWLKPLRYPFYSPLKSRPEDYPFFKMTGEEIHEVAVGPVHAGIIEPGHFRFLCNGENIHHLEIQLGYQHRGVERLIEKSALRAAHIAESIAGDSVIAHAEAYAEAMESLSGIETPLRAQAIRAVALELERSAVHTGDLSAIASDVAYLPGNSVLGAIRTGIINTSLALCGSRFGRGLIRPGGTVFDIDAAKSDKILKNIKKADKDVKGICEIMFSSASVLSRLQNTGVLSRETARQIGLTGVSAKASGVALDSRSDNPYGIYNRVPVYKKTMESGDCFARAYVRYMEIEQSFTLIREILEDNMPQGKIFEEPFSLRPGMFTVSITEGWRGSVMHAAITGKSGELIKYKVKDPSVNNWYGLALAVRMNGISDFPVCNKSFNLSYCGNDL